ncbi:MAG TPA: DMT family transporter [Nitrososphaerales archaeon]|nr:DMT family transporter [Nitrososphaerales archaeon]
MATAGGTDNTRGYLYAFLAAICGGAIPTLSKLTLTQAGPLQVAGPSFLLSGLMLLPFNVRELPGPRSLKYVVFFGVIGAALGPAIYQFGLSETTAVNVSLLSNGEVLFTAVMAFAFLGERLGRRQLAMGLLIVAGIIVVSTNLDLSGVQFATGLEGNLLVLGATLCWSVENNLLISATRRFGALLVTKYRNIIGGAIVVATVLVLGEGLGYTSTGVFYLILLALSLASTSYLAILSLGALGAIRAILVFSTNTVFGAVFALLILGEQITAYQLLGGALILVGVYSLQRSERGAVKEKPLGSL